MTPASGLFQLSPRIPRSTPVALSDFDRNLLDRCLQRQPRSWENFVDRFLGLVIHVINHTAQSRSIRLMSEDREDMAAEIFLTLVQNDFAVLRRFKGQSSLATYLTVVARRVAVRQLIKQKLGSELSEPSDAESQSRRPRSTSHPSETRRSFILNAPSNDPKFQRADPGQTPEERLSNHEEVSRLLNGLDIQAAQIVRMYHLEGKTYREISTLAGVPENSIGPTLSRARAKMRQQDIDTALNS